MRVIRGGVIAALLLACGGQSFAEVRLMKCEGTGLDEGLNILDKKAFFFKFDELAEKVTWVQGDGISKINTDRIDADHLWFTAETQYIGKYNLFYRFILDRNSGSGSVGLLSKKPDGSFERGASRSYTVWCQPTNKAL